MPEISAILASGEMNDYKKGGTTSKENLLTQEEIEAIYPDIVHFSADSLTTITLSTDPTTPSYFPLDNRFDGHECELVNALTGEVRNTSDRVIETLVGNFSFTPQKDGAGTTVLYIVSERSTDNGVTWLPNPESLRTFELKRDINQFGTKVSMLFNWLPDEIVRFKGYASSNLDLVSDAATIEGFEYVSISWFWALMEVD